MGRIVAGAAAGAAGTTVLNAVTYLDMAVRARPASSTPEDTVEALASRAGVQVPGDEDTRQARLAGLGPLSGIVTGVGVGALGGLLLGGAARRGAGAALVSGVAIGAGAMLATDGSMTALGVTDPRTWDATSWVSDAVPHAAYGVATAAVLRALLR
ncbi:hypothetical protein [Motilibacter rhizosphaerae]|uniref:hypothetical protein n=1 Tax=Motilibacter rhizosphaerae TaxID=598652 RepID=UPI00102B42B3|nr:hypothetical protein [Motilibacter rhizosphaerae]